MPTDAHFYFCKNVNYDLGCHAAMCSSCMDYWIENGNRFIDSSKKGPSEEEMRAVKLGEEGRNEWKNARTGNAKSTQNSKNASRRRRNKGKQMATEGPDVKRRKSTRTVGNTFSQKEETTHGKDRSGCRHGDQNVWHRSRDFRHYFYEKHEEDRCLLHCIDCKEHIVPADMQKQWAG